MNVECGYSFRLIRFIQESPITATLSGSAVGLVAKAIFDNYGWMGLGTALGATSIALAGWEYNPFGASTKAPESGDLLLKSLEKHLTTISASHQPNSIHYGQEDWQKRAYRSATKAYPFIMHQIDQGTLGAITDYISRVPNDRARLYLLANYATHLYTCQNFEEAKSICDRYVSEVVELVPNEDSDSGHNLHLVHALLHLPPDLLGEDVTLLMKALSLIDHYFLPLILSAFDTMDIYQDYYCFQFEQYQAFEAVQQGINLKLLPPVLALKLIQRFEGEAKEDLLRDFSKHYAGSVFHPDIQVELQPFLRETGSLEMLFFQMRKAHHVDETDLPRCMFHLSANHDDDQMRAVIGALLEKLGQPLDRSKYTSFVRYAIHGLIWASTRDDEQLVVRILSTLAKGNHKIDQLEVYNLLVSTVKRPDDLSPSLKHFCGLDEVQLSLDANVEKTFAEIDYLGKDLVAKVRARLNNVVHGGSSMALLFNESAALDNAGSHDFLKSALQRRAINLISSKELNELIDKKDFSAWNILFGISSRQVRSAYEDLKNKLADHGTDLLGLPNYGQLILVHAGLCMIAFKDPQGSYQSLDKMPVKWVKSYFQAAFFHPEIFSHLHTIFFKLLELEICDGGNGIANWSHFAGAILDKFAEDKNDQPTELEQALKLKLEEPILMAESVSFNNLVQGWDVEKTLGRTLLFRRGEEYLAIKLQRDNETCVDLWRELRLLDFFGGEWAQKLTSKVSPDGLLTQWPTPQTVCRIHGIPYKLQKSIPVKIFDGHPDMLHAYVYTFPSDSYFRYLHDPDISDEGFEFARKAMFHDLFVLARHRFVYTALADLFHNQEIGANLRIDQGEFLPLPDLFRHQPGRSGTGRLTGIKKATEYVNARRSGLADVGDTDTLSNLSNKSWYNSVFADWCSLEHKGFQNYLLAHYAASYLLVDQLIVARRNHDMLDWQNPDSVAHILHEMKSGYALALASYADVELTIAEKFVENIGINWKRFAQQLCFFMRNDETGYVPHVSKGKIPKEIFGSTAVSIDDTRNFRGWDETLGFTLDGVDPDSGTVNGQHMIKEGEGQWHDIAVMMPSLTDMQSKAKRWRRRAKETDDIARKSHCLRKSLQHNPSQIKVIDQLIPLASPHEANLLQTNRRRWV
ncbi:MAG: hypothetical protein Q8K75_07780 [Chlamydiales bacterium]|nr:hypothetical protein [Chlamydiales bacterium]